jgi:CRP/FNR family transcriptional regulator, cyclic AMP receptor protein
MRFAKGDRVLCEGDSADHVYVMCHGRVKLTASSSDGRSLLLGIAGPGAVLGMAAALYGQRNGRASGTVRVEGDRRAKFLKFMEEYRDVNRNAALTMARDYEEALSSARRLALSGSAAQKLANVLLDWGRNKAADETKQLEFQMPLTHDELGNMAGLSRETVTRILTKFQQEGLLERDGKMMILLRPSEMRAKYS